MGKEGKTRRGEEERKLREKGEKKEIGKEGEEYTEANGGWKRRNERKEEKKQ